MNIDTMIAIDPGANGGIAVRHDGVQVYRMPKDVDGIRDLIERVKGERTLCILEKLQVRHDDMEPGKVFRIQKMLANYEQLKAVLDMEGVPYALVHPASWQARLGLRVKGEAKPDRKRRYRDIARRMWPNLRVTLWNADALLMLSFGTWAIRTQSWLRANLPKKAHWILEC